jgi:predicted DNA binding CopG/RHH family protein
MPNQPRDDNPARAVRVPDPLWDAAKARAAERGETVSDLIRRALQRYVARSDTPGRHR